MLKEPISTYQCRFVDVSKCLVVNINTIEEGGGGGGLVSQPPCEGHITHDTKGREKRKVK